MSFFDGKLPEYLIDNCDLALGIFGETLKAERAIPNKVVEALSMGIPTLTRHSPALNEFFDIELDLWTCEPSPDAIADAILKIYLQSLYPVSWQSTLNQVEEGV